MMFVSSLFIQFWNVAFGIDEYWWSINAAGSTIYVALAIYMFYNFTNHEFKESLTISISNGIGVFWIIG